MVLSDRDIENAIVSGEIIIKPFVASRVQPASYDVALGSEFRVFNRSRHTMIDPLKRQEELTEITVVRGRPFNLHPGEFVLPRTVEWVEIGTSTVARLEGKSSLGRLGLLIHSTAGWFDPGFKGTATLELSNIANLPILLHPEMLIGQFAFMRLSSECERPYGSADRKSRYQGQTSPAESRSWA
jgi:dCTP deaminase